MLKKLDGNNVLEKVGQESRMVQIQIWVDMVWKHVFLGSTLGKNMVWLCLVSKSELRSTAKVVSFNKALSPGDFFPCKLKG